MYINGKCRKQLEVVKTDVQVLEFGIDGTGCERYIRSNLHRITWDIPQVYHTLSFECPIDSVSFSKFSFLFTLLFRQILKAV
jgi:hypothetical protein